MEGMDLKEGKGGGRKIVEDRLMEIERKMEMREREERRKNIIIKGVKVKNGRRREAVEEVLKRTGAKADMEEAKKLGGEEGKGGEILLVKLKEKE